MQPMRFRSCLVAVCLFVLGWSQPAQARLCGRKPANDALAQASVVVKGAVVRAETASGINPDSTITFRIDRVLKGRFAFSSVTVTFFECGREHRYALNKDRPVIAFLDAEGKLIEVLPASSHVTSPNSDPAAALRQEFLVAIDDSDPTLAVIALGALAELDGRNAIPTLNRYRNAKGYGVRFRALTWLARYGDADAFEELTRLVSEPSFIRRDPKFWTDADEPVLTAHRDLQDALLKLETDADNGVTMSLRQKQRYVSALIALARLETRLFRSDAISTLRQIKDPAAYPVLLEALDDRDKDVRFDALYALCEAMNRTGADQRCPSTDVIERDEQKYIAPVRAWARRQRR